MRASRRLRRARRTERRRPMVLRNTEMHLTQDIAEVARRRVREQTNHPVLIVGRDWEVIP